MKSTPRADLSVAEFRAGELLNRLWHASPPLTAVGALMLVLGGASLVGMLVDPRIITGASAWMKPFKFAVSTALYILTLAWIFGYLSDWPRVRRGVGWTTAIVFVLEVALIDTQAWRRTTEPLERVDAAQCGAVLRHGRGDPVADVRQRGGRRRAVAAAIH